MRSSGAASERRQTIVLVTHDSKAAAYADRVLRRPRRPDPRGDRARPARHPRRDAAHRPARPARPVGRWDDGGRGGPEPRPDGARLAQPVGPPGAVDPHARRHRPRGRRPVRRAGHQRRHRPSVDRTVRDLVGRADLRVSAFAEGGLADATVGTIRGTTGVAIAAPRLERRTYLAPTGSGPSVQPPVTVLAIDPVADPVLHDIDGAAALEGPGAPTALVTERLATADGLTVGSTITLQGLGDPGPSTVTIVGILPGDGPLFDADRADRRRHDRRGPGRVRADRRQPDRRRPRPGRLARPR